MSAVLLTLCWPCVAEVRAQFKIDRMFPPVVGPGETEITAEGTVSEWPCDVVCDRDAITVAPSDKKGDFKVVLPKTVAPGVAWVRLTGKHHASRLIPLLVSPIPITREAEAKNNHFRDAQAVALPAVVAGRLLKNGEVDCYAVSLAQDETIVVSVIANQLLRSPMDAVLQIVDTKGNVLAQSDDDRVLDPQLVFQAQSKMDIVVRIFAFPETPNSTIGFSGSTQYVYALRMTVGPFVDHVQPILVGNSNEQMPLSVRGWNISPSSAQILPSTNVSPPTCFAENAMGWHWKRSIAENATTLLASSDSALAAGKLPVVATGEIREPKQIDRVRFQVQKGKKYTAVSYSRREGFRVDTVLRVVETKTQKEIVRKDDMSRTKFDAEVSFTARSDSDYELQISDAVDAFGPRHAYAVLISESKPELSMTVEKDHFELVSGEKGELTINLARENGYDKRLKFVVIGLPPGVKAADVFSEPKGKTAEKVQLTLVADKQTAFQGSIQVQAVEMDGEKATDIAHSVGHLLLDQLIGKRIWLTVGVKK